MPVKTNRTQQTTSPYTYYIILGIWGMTGLKQFDNKGYKHIHTIR